nr:hypothetical protein [Kofleriaceae bacterium]
MVLVLEITSTRLFAYVGSSHATSTALSVALLGLGAGAAVRVRWPRWVQPRGLAPALAVALVAVAAAASFGAPLDSLVAVELLPFAIAGALVSDAYAARGGAAARATYAVDLASAALGCVVAPRLIGPLAPHEIALALAALACGLAIALDRRARARLAVAAIAALVVALFALGRAGALPDGPLAVLLDADPGSEKAIVDARPTAADIVDSEWSAIGRVDVLAAPSDRDARLGVFTDGMSPTYMVEAAGARAATFEDTWGLLMSLPYRALHPARVLVLASGAGASVWLAKKYGATRVDAVEVNPAIPGLLARWRAFAGDVYGEPGVRLFGEDARRYLEDTDDRYDVIELALALTGNAHAQPAGMEAHLYTVEAVELYLSRLADGGSLVLVHSDPGNAYRQLVTVIEALARRGVAREHALDGIVVLHDPRPGTAYRFSIVVRASPMPIDVADRLDVEPAELLWGPGDPPERAAQLLDPKRLGATARDDLSPVHDDRPFFFQNTKGLEATALAEPGRLWVLAGALALVIVLVAWGRRSDDLIAPPFARAAAVATALGAGFLCVELALIQRFTPAAGGALYAVSYVLFGLLAWSAVGALVLGRWWRRRARGVTWACLAAAAAVAATALAVRDLAWLDAIASDGARLALVGVLVAPVGLAIGGPFPTLLAHHGEPARRVASLWAINGAAAVAGGIVGVLALRVGGSHDALVLAACAYAAAAVVAPPRRSLP